MARTVKLTAAIVGPGPGRGRNAPLALSHRGTEIRSPDKAAGRIAPLRFWGAIRSGPSQWPCPLGVRGSFLQAEPVPGPHAVRAPDPGCTALTRATQRRGEMGSPDKAAGRIAPLRLVSAIRSGPSP